MKFSFLIIVMMQVANLFSQDYIIEPNGAKHEGQIISMSKNTLMFKNSQGDLDQYKIDRLSVVHIADPKFKMKGVNLNNTNFEKTEDGIHIVMLDNPISKSKTSCQSASKSRSTNLNSKSEKSSSLSISSEDDGPKANVILECDDCSTSGTLVMESEDKLTNVMWNFDCSEGSAFPMELEIDCNKTYNFKYKDRNKQTIEKKIKIKSGMNIINVFQ